MIWIAAIGAAAAVVQAIYRVLEYHWGKNVDSRDSSTRCRPYIGLVLTVFLTWGAVAFDYYDRHSSPQDITKDSGILRVWGEVPYREGAPYQVQVVADGRRLLPYQSTHRVAAMCFRSDGTKDYLDIEDLQKSALYDIQDSTIHMIFAVDDKFVEGWKRGERGTNYFLFLFPKGVTMDQFSTIRQAQALGAIQLMGGLGFP